MAAPEGYANTIHTTTPDGLWDVATTTITTTSTVITAVEVPPPPGIIIPDNAKTSGILDNKSNWKAEKDAGTPGSVTSTFNKYISADQGREFQAVYENHGGMRWSNNWGKSETATNFVYDLMVKSHDWTQVNQLELDQNQSMSDGNNVFLCTQANFVSGCWDYTLTPGDKCHWYHSNIKVSRWKPDTWVHIRIKTSRDKAYTVTYEGIEIDGVYTAFDATCKGKSAFVLNWTHGVLINNYQTNGAHTSGTMDTFSKQMQVWYW